MGSVHRRPLTPAPEELPIFKHTNVLGSSQLSCDHEARKGLETLVYLKKKRCGIIVSNSIFYFITNILFYVGIQNKSIPLKRIILGP